MPFTNFDLKIKISTRPYIYVLFGIRIKISKRHIHTKTGLLRGLGFLHINIVICGLLRNIYKIDLVNTVEGHMGISSPIEKP